MTRAAEFRRAFYICATPYVLGYLIYLGIRYAL